jgi:hypothetical protein
MFGICFAECGVKVWIAGPDAAYATAPAAIAVTSAASTAARAARRGNLNLIVLPPWSIDSLCASQM